MLVILELANISCGMLVSKNDHACGTTCSIPCIVHMYNYIMKPWSAVVHILRFFVGYTSNVTQNYFAIKSLAAFRCAVKE